MGPIAKGPRASFRGHNVWLVYKIILDLVLMTCYFVHVVGAKNSYIILSPRTFRPGTQYNVTVNVFAATGDVNVTAFFNGRKSSSNSTIYIPSSMTATGIFRPGVPDTLAFNIADDFDNYIIFSGNEYQVEVHGSGGLNFSHIFYATFVKPNIGLFIQTDRAVYKPGGTVYFRTFGLYSDLSVYKENLTIEIKDPHDNVVKRMDNTSTPYGVVEGLLPMDERAPVGLWEIKVKSTHTYKRRKFSVDHYNLPRFQVEIDTSTYGLLSDTTLAGKIRARYTYGEPVSGQVRLKVSARYSYNAPVVNSTFKIRGDANFSVPLTAFYRGQPMWQRTSVLTVEAEVTDDVYSTMVTGRRDVHFYEEPMRIEFVKTNPKYFKPGITYRGKVKAMLPDGSPLTNITEPLKLTVTVNQPEYLLNLAGAYKMAEKDLFIPPSGIVPVEIDIPKDANLVVLYISYGVVRCNKFLFHGHSPSDTYLKLSLLSDEPLYAGRKAVFRVSATQEIMSLYYQVESHQTLVGSGSENAGFTKTFTFTIDITESMAPIVKVVVYIVAKDGEIVADAIELQVKGMFRNKVSVSFDKTQAKPGDVISLNVQADPHSVVNIIMVDQSVNFNEESNDITTASIMDYLSNYGRGYDYFEGVENAEQTFKSLAINVGTDALLYKNRKRRHSKRLKQQKCDPPPPPYVGINYTTAITGPYLETPDLDVFPETWVWISLKLGTDRKASVYLKAPPNAIWWQANAFSINNNTGFGVADKPAKIRITAALLVTVRCPALVKRGEKVVVQAMIFSKMAMNDTVSVLLNSNSNFSNIVWGRDGSEQYLHLNQTKTTTVVPEQYSTVLFPVLFDVITTATLTVQVTLGSDIYEGTASVKVLEKGILVQHDYPVFINLTQNNVVTQRIHINDTRNSTSSKTVRVSFTGDLMSAALNHLENLIWQSTDCGEQSLLDFTVATYILDYLNATNQLKEDVQDNLQIRLQKGYQRALSFQQREGAFNFWGNRSDTGNVWLTAYFVRSLNSAQRWTFVDDDVITRALKWLMKQQDTNGEFLEKGAFLSDYLNNMQNSSIYLTSFVTIAMIEILDNIKDAPDLVNVSVANSTKFLEYSLNRTSDLFALAITSYALSLGKSLNATDAYARLGKHAILKDGMKYWNVSGKATVDEILQPSHVTMNSLDIEMASYILLYYVTTNQQLTNSLPVLKWLLNQQTYTGGFKSTQDTVVALEALSKYIITNDIDMQIEVSSENRNKSIFINTNNSLTEQMIELPPNTEEIKINASGRGLAFIHVLQEYHSNQTRKIDLPYIITKNISNQTLSSIHMRLCVRNAETNDSVMVAMVMGIPTGYDVDMTSMIRDTEVKKTEVVDGSLITYFEKVDKNNTCISFDLTRKHVVAEVRPTFIRVYSYYNPDKQTTEFLPPDVFGFSTICDACKDCGCP